MDHSAIIVSCIGSSAPSVLRSSGLWTRFARLGRIRRTPFWAPRAGRSTPQDTDSSSTWPRCWRLLPFVEISYGRIADVNGGLFNAESFYGKTSFWSLSIGSRLNVGLPLHRMGRYGVAQDTAPPRSTTTMVIMIIT